MLLGDIIGHEKPLSILRGYVVRGRVPHAMLFAGEEGIGKRLTAVTFAKALNCLENREALSDAGAGALLSGIDCCDNCPSCVKAEKSSHPDILMIGPEGEGRQIVISSIRRLQEIFAYRPFEGLWKIAVIDDAETLNQSAANAFLETLEEPPDRSMLILVSSRPEMLLPTIRSRCHTIHFSPLPLSAMADLLKEKLGAGDHERSALLSTLSGGRVGYAIGEDLIAERERSLQEFRDLLDTPDKNIWEDRDGMEKWFDWNQLWLRDIAVLKATGDTGLLVNGDRSEEIQEISGKADLGDILALARKLDRIRQLLRYNLNKQVTLNYTNLLLRKMLGSADAKR